ncbi:MAG: hypothetical protein U1E93_06225 [Alphaproteobacteria bacterium]
MAIRTQAAFSSSPIFEPAGIHPPRGDALMTPEQFNRDLMLSVLGAFKSGDLQPLFDAVSPDIVWKATAPREYLIRRHLSWPAGG